jgi:hypothetical protein
MIVSSPEEDFVLRRYIQQGDSSMSTLRRLPKEAELPPKPPVPSEDSDRETPLTDEEIAEQGRS